MPLIREDDLVRIDLPENGEWVEVKRRPSRYDLVRVQQATAGGAHLSADGRGGLQVSDLTAAPVLEAAEFATLDIAIKRWSFTDPVTPENIRALDEPSVDCIKAALNDLWRARSEEESRNLNGSSQAAASGLPNSAG